MCLILKGKHIHIYTLFIYVSAFDMWCDLVSHFTHRKGYLYPSTGKIYLHTYIHMCIWSLRVSKMCLCCFADTNTHRVTASKAPKCRLNGILKAVKQLVYVYIHNYYARFVLGTRGGSWSYKQSVTLKVLSGIGLWANVPWLEIRQLGILIIVEKICRWLIRY